MSLVADVELLEREAELCRLKEAVAAARAGAGRLILITGAAGSGKSALVGAAAEHARLDEVSVLRAVCSPLERGYAYGALRQLFEPALASLPSRERDRLLAGAAAPARSVVAPGARGGPLADTEFVMLHAIYWLAGNLAAGAPLLLAVDDCHWIDEPSMRALGHLARRLFDLPIVLIVALRPDEPGTADSLLDDLRATPGIERIVPPPLTRTAVATVARGRLVDVDEEMCAALHDASAGNPFYLAELVRALAGTGMPSSAEVRDLSVPELGDRIIRRIGRLGTSAPALATAMAVLGDGSRLTVAASLAGLDESAAARVAQRLVRIEILATADPCAFAHPLVRRSVYGSLSVVERDRAHAAAARLLWARGAPAEIVALHMAQMRPASSSTVATTLLAAAQSAQAHAAQDTAARLLRRALAEQAPEPSRPTLLFALGQAEMALADHDAAAHLAEALATEEDPVARGRVALVFAEMLFALGRHDAGIEVVQSAIRQLDEHDPELVVELEALRAAAAGYDPRLRPGLLRELPRLTELATGAGWGARALAGVLAASEAVRCGAIDRVVSLVEACLHDGQLLQRRGGGWAAAQALSALLWVDEFERTHAAAAQVESAGHRTGSLIGVLTGVAYRGAAHARCGELVDAEATLAAALQIARQSGMGLWIPTGYQLLIDVLLERPSLHELAAAIEGLQLPPDLMSTVSGAFLLEPRGRLRLLDGRRRAAIDDLRQCADISRGLGIGPLASPWRSELGLALMPEAPDESGALIAEELALARSSGLARPIGVALRASGLCVGGDDGIDLLRESVSTLEGSEAGLELARSLTELGSTLRRRHHRREAREPLGAAMDLAHRCGADRLLERARDELRAAGARPRRIVRTGVDALTASELRIARLAANGRPNVEIAQQLYVSLKTVETHLSHVYTKLNLSGQGSRRQLSEALGQTE